MTISLFKRLIPVLLVCCMLLTFAGCGNTSGNQGSTATESQTTKRPSDSEETETRISTTIPATYDWGEQELNFLCWYRSDWSTTVRTFRDITSEELTGDLVTDAVYMRNSMIRENYNVSINMDFEAQQTINTKIRNLVSTGDTTYDVIYPRLHEGVDLVAQGMYLNLYSVPNLNLEKPWWDQNCIDALSIQDKLFMCASALNVNDKDATAALAFNKKECLANGLTYFYDYVADGSWTLEVLSDAAYAVQKDMNGDDRYTEEDFWGFLGKNDVMTSFFLGCGGAIVTKDNYGGYVFSCGTDNDIDASLEIVEFMNEDCFYNHHKAGINDIEYTRLFTSGHGLFFWMRLDEVTNMRSSEVEFGILPIPKLDESQEKYRSMVSPWICGITSIPPTNKGDRLEMTGMILEAMSADSYYGLQDAYQQQSLKTKFSSDEESSESLSIILENRIFDPGYIYNFGAFGDKLQEMGAARGSLASLLAQYKSSTDTAIDKFLIKIDALEN